MSGGKRIRGLTTARTYEAFAGDQITEDNLKLSGILGLLLEMVSLGWLAVPE